MLEQATDVPAGGLGEVGVGVLAEEQGLTTFPEALVHVHAAAVVGKDRLGHERGCASVLAGHVADDVLVDHHVVRRGDQLGELHAQFVLGCGHLVVMLLDGYAQLGHGQQHLAAHVLQGVVGADGEIALFELDLVSEVAPLFLAGAVPWRLDGIDAVEAAAVAGVEADVVEDEEFRLRSKEGRIGEPGAGQVADGALGQGARAAVVGLAAAGLLDRADQAEGFLAVEGIDPGGAGIGHHRHVRFVDGLPAANGGSVKGQSFCEGLLFHQIAVNGQVLPLSVDIGEFQINEFDAFILDLTKDVPGCLGHGQLLESKR